MSKKDRQRPMQGQAQAQQPPRTPPAPTSPTTSPPAAVDLDELRRRLLELEGQVADLKPKADAWRAQKDDLGRQKHQAEKAERESNEALRLAKEAEVHHQAERRLLSARAEELVAADRTALLARATEQAADMVAKAEANALHKTERAEQAAAALQQGASDEAARIRKEAVEAATAHQAAILAKATAEAASRLEAAEGDADARLRSARAEALALLAEARTEAAATRAGAESDRATAAEERLVAERFRTERLRVGEQESRAAATVLAQRIEEDARRKATEILTDAERRRVTVEARESAVRHAEESVTAREVAAATAERRTGLREQALEAREMDVEAAERAAYDRAEVLTRAESRLGAAAVARLTEERDEAREMLEESRKRNRESAAERDRLARALEAAGGADLGARTAEIEHLRARNAELLAERLSMASEEELAALRAENLRLLDLATRVTDAEARCRELQRAQANADHAVDRARDEAVREVASAQRELAKHVAEIDRLAAELAAVKASRDELQEKSHLLQRTGDDLKSLQIDRDYHEARVRELERSLDDRNKRSRQRAVDRYGKLAELDLKPTSTGLGNPEPPPDLGKVAQEVQARMAGDGRFYSEHMVRSWLASLAAHRMVLLQGLSGTGKTSLPIGFARAIGGWCVTIPVQSGWRDKSDLFGFYNTFDNRFRASEFTRAAYEANLPDLADRPVFLVLDECNLSRVEYYLADLLSELQLDPREQGEKKLGPSFTERFPVRPPHLVHVSDQPDTDGAPNFLPDGRYLALPQNVWIIATANVDDSTFELADKTLDRTGILQMDSRAKPGKGRKEALPPMSWSGLQRAFETARGRWKERVKLQAWIEQLAPPLERRFEVGIGNRFEDQAVAFLPVYEAAGGTREEGVDHLLETRILRKLSRTRDPSRIDDLRAVKDHVVKTWTWGSPPRRSTELLDRILGQLGAK
jgi:hypothetical protein